MSKMNKSTSSEKYRQQGNDYFAKLKEEQDATSEKHQEYFTVALKSYNQALNSCVNDDERASAYKNIGTLYAYQTESMKIESINRKHLDYNFSECINSYGHAYEFGRTTKSNNWLTALRQKINNFVDDRYTAFLKLPSEEQLSILLFVVNCFECTTFEKLDSVANVYFSLGQLTFDEAVRHFNKHPKLIYECQPHVDRAIYWSCEPKDFRANEIEKLRYNIWLYQCKHESSKARHAGIRMLEAYLNNDEEKDEDRKMDIVWNIIDKFREAMLLAKEHDFEGEARACHHTAEVYQNVLKIPELAYMHHLNCVALAQNLIPRDLTSRDWYMKSTSLIQQYRAKKIRDEAAINQRQNNQFRIELKSELEKLEKKSSKGARQFLQHIYEKHPPRKERAKLGSIRTDDRLKKFMKTAISHYHPDSQAVYKDAKWSFLCGEITKILNFKYNNWNPTEEG